MGVDAAATGVDQGAEGAFSPLQAIVGLGAIQALTMLAGLVRTKVLALLLGTSGLGIAGVIDQVVALMTHLGSLSLPFAAVKFLSKRKGEGLDAFGRLYGAFLRTLLVASILTTVIAVAIAAARTDLLAGELEEFRTPLIAGLLGVPAIGLVALLRSVLAALERHRQAAVAALVGTVLLVGASYVGIRLAGLTGLYLGNLGIQAALAAGLVAYLARRANLRLAAAPVSTFRTLRAESGLVTFCTVIHLLTLVTPLAYLVTRVAVLSSHGATAAGLFYAGYGIAVAMRVVLNQANGLYLTPIVNQRTPKSARAAAAGEYARVLVVMFVVAACAIVLFPDLFLVLLYSPQFGEARGFLGVFVLSEGILLIAGVYQALLIGFDDLRAHLGISVTGYAGVAALSLLLIPRLGPLGAAFAFVGGHGLILVLTALRLRIRHGARDLGRSWRLGSAAIAVLGLGVLWTTQVAAPPALRTAAFAAVTALFVGTLRPEERAWLAAPWRRQGRR